MGWESPFHSLGVTMNARAFSELLVITGVVAIATAGGSNAGFAFIGGFLGVMIGISWYFHSCRSGQPFSIEATIATTWLFVRRLVGFIGAVFFLCLAVMVAFALFPQADQISILYRLGAAVFFLLASGFCISVAIFGHERRSGLRVDIARHRENKRRYRWRW